MRNTPQAGDSVSKLQKTAYDRGRQTQTVNGLWNLILNKSNLQAAWERVANNSGANTPGPNGQRCLSIRNVPGLIHNLRKELTEETWKPGPVLPVAVKKNDHTDEKRHLAILNVQDRVVHTAVKQILEPVLDHRFLNHSFGFRPARSVSTALNFAVQTLRTAAQNSKPLRYAVRLDVANCFDTIDHSILQAQLQSVIGDPPLLRLLTTVLEKTVPIMSGQRHPDMFSKLTHAECEWFAEKNRKRILLRRPKNVGIPQGSSLAPLLCNTYLHELDVTFHELTERTDGSIHALRYADDLLLLTTSRWAAWRAIRRTKCALRNLRQKLNRSKVLVTPLHRGVNWLGKDLVVNRFHGHDVPEFFIPQRKLERAEEKLIALFAQSGHNPTQIKNTLADVNQKLLLWSSGWRGAANERQACEHIRHVAIKESQKLRRHLSPKHNRLPAIVPLRPKPNEKHTPPAWQM